MEVARLVLEYLKELIWPMVTVFGMVIFRANLRALVDRLQFGKFAGVEFQLHQLAAVGEVEAQVETVARAGEERNQVLEEILERSALATVSTCASTSPTAASW
jgi:hypothetical protein